MASHIIFLSFLSAFALQSAFGASLPDRMRARAPLKIRPGTHLTQQIQTPAAGYNAGVASLWPAPGDSIGYTCYNFATNGSANDNIINFGDGTISIGRMASLTYGQATWPDLATYYTYFNGMSWSPFTRVESTKAGWGNIDQFIDGGGIEVTVSNGPMVNIDGSKGAASWMPVSPMGAKGIAWPKMVAGIGANIYIVASDGIPDSVYFESSPDGGSTWLPSQLLFWGATGGDADAYDIATDGNNVAVISSPAGKDVWIVRSSDGGTSWGTPQKIFDAKDDSGSIGIDERSPYPDGSCSIMYDRHHNLHAFWGAFTGIGDSLRRPAAYFALDNRIMHWSQSTGVTTVALAQCDSAHLAGTSVNMPGIDGALVTSPQAGVDEGNSLYVVCMGQSNDVRADSLPYMHVYAGCSTDGGGTWYTKDVTPTTGIDNTWPSVAWKVGTNVHLVYNSDFTPGNDVETASTAPDTLTQIKYLEVQAGVVIIDPPPDTSDAVPQVSDPPERFELQQNFPNPFNASTTISYSIPKTGSVGLIVTDLLGRHVARLVDGIESAGFHRVRFDGSRLASGMYVYRLTTGGRTLSGRMILMR